ncbi:hypothetical protein LTS12_027436, partial [Elasticomyces elasticus]
CDTRTSKVPGNGTTYQHCKSDEAASSHDARKTNSKLASHETNTITHQKLISTNDSIREELEETTGTPRDPLNEVLNTSIKPQALSDNELGQLPPFRRGHSRSQSAIIPSRSMTAPGPAVQPQEQSLCEMEVIQNLLRKSTKRDDLTFEVRDLKAEI